MVLALVRPVSVAAYRCAGRHYHAWRQTALSSGRPGALLWPTARTLASHILLLLVSALPLATKGHVDLRRTWRRRTGSWLRRSI